MANNPWLQLRNGSVVRASLVQSINIHQGDESDEAEVTINGDPRGERGLPVVTTGRAKEFALLLAAALSTASDISLIIPRPAGLNQMATIETVTLPSHTLREGVHDG